MASEPTARVLTLSFQVEGQNFRASGEAAGRIKRALEQVGLDWSIIRRAAVVIYEAEMNIVIHARRGVLSAEITPDQVVIVADDEGPGIPDIALAMTEGYSTASAEVREMGFGAGMGLPNITKHSDEMRIETEVGKGTRVTAVIRVGACGDGSRAVSDCSQGSCG